MIYALIAISLGLPVIALIVWLMFLFSENVMQHGELMCWVTAAIPFAVMFLVWYAHHEQKLGAHLAGYKDDEIEAVQGYDNGNLWSFLKFFFFGK